MTVRTDRTGRRARRSAYGSGLLSALIAACALGGPAEAGVRIHSTISVCGAGSCDTLQAVTYLQGRWMRRELRGHGMLATLFGNSIRILDREGARAWTLHPDEKSFRVDTLRLAPCTPEALVDLRLLGSAHRRARTEVSLPDTTRQIHGVPARPVQIDIFPRNPARDGTRIRIWTTTALEQLFGPNSAADLYCGGVVAPPDSAPPTAEIWRAQFNLADADLKRMVTGMTGYAVLIESRFGSDTTAVSTTTIATVAIEQAELSPDLFAPPPDYVEAEADTNGAADQEPTSSAPPKR
jgi:hypothetical protein